MTDLESLLARASEFTNDEREDIRRFAAECEDVLMRAAVSPIQTIDWKPEPLNRHHLRTATLAVEDFIDHTATFYASRGAPGVSALIEIQASLDGEHWYTVHPSILLPADTFEMFSFQSLHKYIRIAVVGWAAPWSAPVSSFEIWVRYLAQAVVKKESQRAKGEDV